MTIVDEAIKELKSYSPVEQNKIAKWLLEELKSDRKWDNSFSESENILEQLANETLEEERKGETTVFEPEKL